MLADNLMDLSGVRSDPAPTFKSHCVNVSLSGCKGPVAQAVYYYLLCG
jgi:hypothetical protein